MAAAAMTLPLLALSAPWLLTSRCLHGLDFAATYRPLAVLAKDGLERDGELPRWNPYQYAGTPFLGNGQWTHLYPPNWLFLALRAEEAFEVFVFLHLLLAAFGMYRLVRGFRASRPACVVAALGYALSFGLVARVYAGHLTIVVTLAQAPLLLHLLRRTLETPTSLHAAGLASWTGLVITGGHPQFVYHLALLAAAFAAWRVGAMIRRKEPWRRPAAVTAGAALLGVALSAAFLLPALEVGSLSTRGGSDPYAGQHGIPPHETLLPHNLLSLLVPASLRDPGHSGAVEIGFWHEKALYAGILPLLLVPFAALARPRGPVIFFAVAALLAVADGMASTLPVHDALVKLPGYGSFRVPPRAIWMAGLAIPALAAFGWDAAFRTRRPLVILAVTAIAALVLAGKAPLAAAAILVSAAAVVLSWCHPRWAAAPVLVLAADLLLAGLPRLRTVPREEYTAPPWYARHIPEKERAAYRVLDLTRVEAEPTAHGFRLLRGCGYPLPRVLADFWATAWENYKGPITNSLSTGDRLANPSVLDRLNVRWIVSRDAPAHPRWEKVAESDGLFLYEDPDARPLAYLREGGGTAEATRPGANRISLSIRADRPSVVVVSETALPGWSAPDGWSRLDEPLLAFRVPAGSAQVELVYAPPGRGNLVSLLALLGVAAVGLRAFRKRLREDDKLAHA